MVQGGHDDARAQSEQSWRPGRRRGTGRGGAHCGRCCRYVADRGSGAERRLVAMGALNSGGGKSVDRSGNQGQRAVWNRPARRRVVPWRHNQYSGQGRPKLQGSVRYQNPPGRHQRRVLGRRRQLAGNPGRSARLRRGSDGLRDGGDGQAGWSRAPGRPPPIAAVQHHAPARERARHQRSDTEPCLVGLWHGGGAPPLCRGVERGVGDRNEPRARARGSA